MAPQLAVQVIWNFFPFSLVIWNPFRFFLNIPFAIPYIVTIPLQIALNTVPELFFEAGAIGASIYGYINYIQDDYDTFKMKYKEDLLGPEYIILSVMIFSEVILIWLILTFPTNIISLFILFVCGAISGITFFIVELMEDPPQWLLDLV